MGGTGLDTEAAAGALGELDWRCRSRPAAVRADGANDGEARGQARGVRGIEEGVRAKGGGARVCEWPLGDASTQAPGSGRVGRPDRQGQDGDGQQGREANAGYGPQHRPPDGRRGRGRTAAGGREVWGGGGGGGALLTERWVVGRSPGEPGRGVEVVWSERRVSRRGREAMAEWMDEWPGGVVGSGFRIGIRIGPGRAGATIVDMISAHTPQLYAVRRKR